MEAHPGKMMEDKKRGISSTDTVSMEPSAKKMHLDPDVPQDEIVQFQKEAIWRQMQAYKREKELLESSVADLSAKYDALQTSFSLLDTWWDQLLDHLAPQIVAVENGASGGQIPPTLLLDAETVEFSSVLERKRAAIEKTLAPIFGSLNTSIGGASVEKSISSLSASLNHLRAQNDKAKLDRDRLASQLESVTAKYLSAARKFERFESPSLKKMFNTVVPSEPQEDAVPASISSSSPQNGNGTVTPKDKEPETSSSSSAEALAEVENIKGELAQSEAVVAKQKQQLAEQEERTAELEAQIRDLTARIMSPSDGDTARSQLFISVNTRAGHLERENSRLEKINERLKKEMADFSVYREEFKLKTKRDFDMRREELERQVERLDADVARIRAARDKILGELNQKKVLEAEKCKSMDELKELVGIRQSRIEALEQEIKQFISEPVEVSDDSSPEELKQKLQKLRQQNGVLAAELPSLEAAFAQANKKALAKVLDTAEREAKMNKLIAEKGKADEKYFSAMREKDAIQNELERLKTRISRYAGIVQELKDSEERKTKKITALEQQLEGAAKAKSDLEKELENLRMRLVTRDRQLDACAQSSDSMKQVLAEKDAELRKMVESKRQLEAENEKLRTQVDTKRATTLGGSSDAEEQIEALRSIALCSVCSKNWKDTAIKSCGHVLCNDCALDRLNARLRKCPMCNKQYSHSDLLSVHL
ncbi:E3 ubiquitin-protein ligase Bre1p [Trichomonascus vanleenenianus]|uniref:E3 ubiquitin-protein ligase BRE1 n=1 Tax=Trichomonascus vanleenenianus TaxID=2268995 RepID=UPI003ECAFA98